MVVKEFLVKILLQLIKAALDSGFEVDGEELFVVSAVMLDLHLIINTTGMLERERV